MLHGHDGAARDVAVLLLASLISDKRLGGVVVIVSPDRRLSAFGGGPLAAPVLRSNALARDLRTSPCGALPQQSRNTVRTARKLSPVVMNPERIRRLGLDGRRLVGW